MEEKIRVGVRFRPLNHREAADPGCFTMKSDDRITAEDFDHFFDGESENEMVYDTMCRQIVKSSMDGINGAIMAYGQTGTGKTYTMSAMTDMAVTEIFRHIHETPEREYLLRISFVELYNEVLYDLLAPDDSVKLSVVPDPTLGVAILDLKEDFVCREADMHRLLSVAESRRHTAATKMNQRSSRSHAICRLVIESRSPLQPGSVRVSSLHFVDLAGSERVGHTGAEGSTFSEGIHINKSLLTLGMCIQRLSEASGNEMMASPMKGSPVKGSPMKGALKPHIPFRNSKLTRILAPALGGNARTCIICTATRSARYREDTLSTLRFAKRAAAVSNVAKVNETHSDQAQLNRYRQDIQRLEAALAAAELEVEQTKVGGQAEDVLSPSSCSRLREENLRMNMELSLSQASCDEMKENVNRMKQLMKERLVNVDELDKGVLKRVKKLDRKKSWSPGDHLKFCQGSKENSSPFPLYAPSMPLLESPPASPCAASNKSNALMDKATPVQLIKIETSRQVSPVHAPEPAISLADMMQMERQENQREVLELRRQLALAEEREDELVNSLHSSVDYSTPEVTMQGYLYKKSRIMGSWERRFCCLVGGGKWMLVFEDEEQSKTATDKIKVLPITAGSVPVAWKCTAEEGRRCMSELFAFVVKGHTKEYVFGSESRDELNCWMNAFSCLADTEVALGSYHEKMFSLRTELEEVRLQSDQLEGLKEREIKALQAQVLDLRKELASTRG